MSLPDAAGSRDTHDADERITAAAFFVKHLESVGGDVGHNRSGVGYEEIERRQS